MTTSDTATTLHLLAVAPDRIREIIAGVEPARLHTVPAHGGWTANDVLAHLRSCADMWGEAIERMLNEDEPTFRAVNPTKHIEQTDYPQQQFHRSFDAFTAQRHALLAILEPLPPEAWERKATVTGAGKALTRTVRFYADWLATHERSHYKPLARIIAAT